MCVVFHTGVLVFSRVDRPARVGGYFIACSAVHQANTTITHPFSSIEISDLSCPSAWQHQNDAIAPALDITPPEITRAAHAKQIVELPFRPDDWLCQATHRHTVHLCQMHRHIAAQRSGLFALRRYFPSCLKQSPHKRTVAPFLMHDGHWELLHACKFNNRPHLSPFRTSLFRDATTNRIGGHVKTDTKPVLIPVPTQRHH